MQITKIVDHVAQALGRLLTQYKSIPKRFGIILNAGDIALSVSALDALVAVFANQIQDLEDASFDMQGGQLFYDGQNFRAVGAQLDGIGAIVGISRNGLSDGEFVLFLLAKIAENFSNGTIPDIIHIASLLFQVPVFKAFPLFPAEFSLQIPDTSPLDPSLYPIVASILEGSYSAGIGLGFVSIYPAANPFLFRDLFGPSVGGGFGDLNAPGTGGQFAYNVFNNPGA